MDPFIGEIRPFPYTFAPLGWFYCDGSLVQISDYEELYSLLGTTYGGDGLTTFGLPDLRGRVPMHQSGASRLGAADGTETVGLTASQVPLHVHTLSAGGPGSAASPVGAYPAASATTIYGPATGSLGPNAIAPNSGSGTPHDNVQPYLALAFCICYQGIYPSQN